MSNENIAKFSHIVAANPELTAKIESLPAQDLARQVALLSAEAGTPFTEEEFLAQLEVPTPELSEEQLESVAGGVDEQALKIVSSIFSAGISCLTMHLLSKTGNRGSCAM